MAHEVCVICPLAVSPGKDVCSGGMERFLFFFLNIHVVVFSVSRWQGQRNTPSLAQMCLGGIREFRRERTKQSLQKERDHKMWVFPSPTHFVFFVQAFRIISLKKNKIKTSARGLFPIFPAAFILSGIFSAFSSLLPPELVPPSCSCKPEAAARWERGTTPGSTAQSPNWVSPTPERKAGGFSHG